MKRSMMSSSTQIFLTLKVCSNLKPLFVFESTLNKKNSPIFLQILLEEFHSKIKMKFKLTMHGYIYNSHLKVCNDNLIMTFKNSAHDLFRSELASLSKSMNVVELVSSITRSCNLYLSYKYNMFKPTHQYCNAINIGE